MRLVLYGGGDYIDNPELNKELLTASGTKNPKVTYIPSSSDYGMSDFEDFVKAQNKIKNCQFIYFPIDTTYSPRLENEALKSDVIFLSGGNTFYFLKTLRAKKLLSKLRAVAKSGRTLGGLSAGAIILSPNISTASFPSWDCDDNYVNLRRFEALNLCPLEFFPHYAHSSRYQAAMKSYSQKSSNTLVAAPDWGGLVYTQNRISYYGKCLQFKKGAVVDPYA